MCLGIPGRLAEFDDTNPHLAVVEDAATMVEELVSGRGIP